MDEIFLKDKETGLLVSNLGRVIGKRGRPLKGSKNNCGYIQVCWRDSLKKPHMIKVHRLVASNFIPNHQNFPQVNHIDENKSNNCSSNLEWCDAKYNLNFGSHTSRVLKTKINLGITKKCKLEKDDTILEANSIHEMARLIGDFPANVMKVLTGKYSHAKGWHLPGVISKRRTKNVLG